MKREAEPPAPGRRRLRTMELIFSVTEAKVCPGSMTGSASAVRASRLRIDVRHRFRLERGVRIAQPAR